MNPIRIGVLCLLVSLLSGGCSSPDIDSTRWYCVLDIDCGEGWRCVPTKAVTGETVGVCTRASAYVPGTGWDAGIDGGSIEADVSAGDASDATDPVGPPDGGSGDDAGSEPCSAGCDDSNPCTVDSCDGASGCSHAPVGGPCDDGDACTLGDTCASGACEPQSTVDCDDGDPCTTDSCDPALECTHVGASGPSCDDGEPCTTDDTCNDGACTGGASICQCETSADCQDDGNDCNGTLVCDGETGTCKVEPGTVVTCDPSSDTTCLAQKCLPSTGKCGFVAIAEGGACSDGSLCTTGDACKGGGCSGKPVTCDDGIGCTTDWCESKAGCKSSPKAEECDDGDPCTTDTCSVSSGCKHTPIPGCTPSCAKDDGLCLALGPADFGVAFKIVSIQFGDSGTPGEGLDLDPENGPSDCAPAGDCSDGIDNAFAGIGSFANDPLMDLVAGGDILLVGEAVGDVFGVFTLNLYNGELDVGSCDLQTQVCDYLVTESSLECDCSASMSFEGATAYDGTLDTGIAASGAVPFFLSAEGAMSAYRLRLVAQITAEDGALSFASGLLGFAVRKADLEAAIDSYPGEDIGGVSKSTVKLFLGAFKADIDTDGDGIDDAISCAYRLEAIGAHLVGVAATP